MNKDVKFEPIGAGDVVEPPEADVPASYENPAAPKAPNSVMIPLGAKGWVSWQSDNPIAVLALIMLVVLLASILLLVALSRLPWGGPWPTKVAELLGQAVLTIVGAIIGSAATNRARK